MLALILLLIVGWSFVAFILNLNEAYKAETHYWEYMKKPQDSGAKMHALICTPICTLLTLSTIIWVFYDANLWTYVHMLLPAAINSFAYLKFRDDADYWDELYNVHEEMRRERLPHWRQRY